MNCTMSSFAILALFATFLLPLCHAHDNGMDMSMDGAMSLTAGHMLPYLHFTPGDTLWFLGWVPTSKGAMGGACVGLFLMGIGERLIAAMRRGMESVWNGRAQREWADRMNRPSTSGSAANEEKPPLKSTTVPASVARQNSITRTITMRTVSPFIASHDITRGVLHALQTALGFSFMLAVMTYNVAFILSLVIGLGVGETLFGRYGAGVGGVYH
ncbi:Ctr copper transporter family-domain-containing protein [Crucibulum laeve]|uniref:Copper transport protein n=1 Tax=Crucibulum laeve TaxID=68775 RepID=A0A5C3LWN2_9AGAR|nr:Ctr copper transporter family-domain-containing protein [Crucibulum laeve]